MYVGDFSKTISWKNMLRHPTRGNNTLDLFATNDYELVSRMVIEDTKLSDNLFFFYNKNDN